MDVFREDDSVRQDVKALSCLPRLPASLPPWTEHRLLASSLGPLAAELTPAPPHVPTQEAPPPHLSGAPLLFSTFLSPPPHGRLCFPKLGTERFLVRMLYRHLDTPHQEMLHFPAS